MATAEPASPETIVVACFCAGWCRLCDDYAAVFREVTTRLGVEQANLRAHWIDIEDDAALCGDLDIETFPTLLVASGRGLHFAGVLEPHAATLERVVRASLETPTVLNDLPQRAAFETIAKRLLAC